MLEGRLVNLRAIRDADAPAFRRWLNDQEIARYMGDRYPMAAEAAAARSQAANMSSFDNVRLAIETKHGEHVGGVNLFDSSPECRSAQIGVMVGERAYWSRGYGSDAVVTALRFAFDEMNLNRVFLQVWSFNERAIAAYRKIGFIEEARMRDDVYTMGCYHDNVIMGILRDERTPVVVPT